MNQYEQTEFILVITTGDDETKLNDLAESLVNDRLVACAQVVGPIKSHYQWQGKLHCDAEWQCQMKTTRDQFDELNQRVIERHHYDNPEIVALPIVAGSEAYLAWIRDNTRESNSE